METVLQIVLVCDTILMITLILLQNRGVALSQTFGGADSSVNYERRGSEKVIHYLTIAAAAVFMGVSFGILFVQ